MKRVAYSVDSEVETTKPKKRFTAASAGSSSSMKRQTKRSHKECHVEYIGGNEDDLSMIEILAKLKENCTCSTKKHSSCYVSNWGLNPKTIKDCLSIFNGLDKEEIRQRQYEIMRTTAPEISATMSKNGKKAKLNYKYEVNGGGVCRNTFLTLYNITDHRFRVFSDQMKSKGSVYVNSEKVKEWTDDNVPDMTYNEMCDCYEDNLQCATGAIIIIHSQFICFDIIETCARQN